MFILTNDPGSHILSVEAAGKVSHEYYRDALIPAAETMIQGGPIKVLCVVRSDLSGFAIEALWDDSKYGVKHWHDISHMALVSDHAWIRVASSLFAPFYPAKIKLFKLDELASATQWIASIA